MADKEFNFSVRNVPESWSEAAADAPRAEPGPLVDRGRRSQRLPTGLRPDIVTGTLSGIAMAVISGAAWYSLSVGGIYRGPWLAMLMGLLIAVSVRLGAGPAGPEMRITAGAPLYVLSVIVTHYFVARQDHMSLFRDAPSAAQVEDILTRDYLSSPMVIVAWIAGLVAMGWCTYALTDAKI
jgi:hypothetical protein